MWIYILRTRLQMSGKLDFWVSLNSFPEEHSIECQIISKVQGKCESGYRE